MAWTQVDDFKAPQPPIKIGVIHSLSGTMARSEKPLVDMVQMAVDEINAAGGLLGRQLGVNVRDTGSSPTAAAKAAERLIVKDGVDVLFGCWTSACRKAVKPVVERHNHVLFYPLQYEGLEQSPNIIYTGAAPNQQIIPAGVWALEQLGRRVFLVGSDYVFPRTANVLLSDV
ncbi:transporter substrate-binding protein, partial [Pseudomonadota bacterium]